MSNRRFLISATLVAALSGAVAPAGAQVTPAAADAPAAYGFTPPANGRLTAEQIRMFIAVRRATAASAERWTPDAEGQIDALTRSFEEEARAAGALGAGIDEYRWVSTRVMDAMPEATTGTDAVMVAIVNAVHSMPPLLDEAARQQVVAIKSPDASASARAYNRQLLGRFQTELRAVLPAARP